MSHLCYPLLPLTLDICNLLMHHGKPWPPTVFSPTQMSPLLNWPRKTWQCWQIPNFATCDSNFCLSTSFLTHQLPPAQACPAATWTTEGRSVWNTSVGHRTLHMNQKMQITYFPNAVVPSVFLHPPAYFASSLWLPGGNGALQDIQHMNQKIFTNPGSKHRHMINKN